MPCGLGWSLAFPEPHVICRATHHIGGSLILLLWRFIYVHKHDFIGLRSGPRSTWPLI